MKNENKERFLIPNFPFVDAFEYMDKYTYFIYVVFNTKNNFNIHETYHW